jgi:hypothetical protein
MEENIPNFVLPEQTGIFKFIQIYVRNEPYLRYENKKHPNAEHTLHTNILEEALKEFGITPVFRRGWSRKMVVGFGDEYKLVGAGKMHRKNEECILYDDSADYNVGPNSQHLEDLAQHLPQGIKLRIDDTK